MLSTMQAWAPVDDLVAPLGSWVLSYSLPGSVSSRLSLTGRPLNPWVVGAQQ